MLAWPVPVLPIFTPKSALQKEAQQMRGQRVPGTPRGTQRLKACEAILQPGIDGREMNFRRGRGRDPAACADLDRDVDGDSSGMKQIERPDIDRASGQSTRQGAVAVITASGDFDEAERFIGLFYHEAPKFSATEIAQPLHITSLYSCRRCNFFVKSRAICAPWKRPFSMKISLVLLPAMITPAR